MIRSSGIGTYIQGLLSVWKNNAASHPLQLFGNPDQLSSWPFPMIKFEAPIYSLREQWAGPTLFSGASLDLLHVPHYNIPARYKGPLVVTIHDIIHLLHPQMARKAGAWLYARVMLKLAVKKAKRIIVVSEKTKEDILERLGADPEKIRVIHPGISSDFSPSSPNDSAATLARHGLKKGFILFVGDVRPHKNVGGLLSAHRLLRKTWTDCPQVVVVGKTERASQSFLNEDNVRWLGGNLPKEELIHLYSAAGVLAFPTLYEGFGLPPLEAMACGCPVVVSSAGALPESVGDAGLYIEPGDPASIAEGITKALREKPLRESLVAKGLARSKTFSWEKAARETWKVYEEALGSA